MRFNGLYAHPGRALPSYELNVHTTKSFIFSGPSLSILSAPSCKHVQLTCPYSPNYPNYHRNPFAPPTLQFISTRLRWLTQALLVPSMCCIIEVLFQMTAILTSSAFTKSEATALVRATRIQHHSNRVSSFSIGNTTGHSRSQNASLQRLALSGSIWKAMMFVEPMKLMEVCVFGRWCDNERG